MWDHLEQDEWLKLRNYHQSERHQRSKYMEALIIQGQWKMLTVSQTVVKPVRQDTGLAHTEQTPREEQASAHLTDVQCGSLCAL